MFGLLAGARGDTFFLLLDEPTQGMAQTDTEEASAVIVSRLGEDMTVILIEHDIEHGVDLTLEEGQCVGLFGHSGVVKTTILKAIAGWIKQITGTIPYRDRQINGLAPDQICRLGIGFVPEDRRIFPGLTVEDNLRLGLCRRPGASVQSRQRPSSASIRCFPG